MTDTTMNSLYGDGSNHAACPKCGNCLVCDKCTCGMTEEEKKAYYDSYFKYVEGRRQQAIWQDKDLLNRCLETQN